MRRQRWEFLARVACVLGGGFLLFSLGEIAQLLDVWPSPYYRQAKEAYDALQEQQRILAEELNPIEKLQNSDAALERAKAQTLDATRLQPGLILVCKKDYTLVLIDRAGKKRHEWRMPPSQIWPNPTHTPNPPNDAAVRCTSAHVYPNGDVVALFHGIGQTPYGFGLAKIDSDAKLIWKYSETTHHNLYVARNGDIYTLVHHFLKEPAKGLEHLNYPVLMDSIDILSPEGQLKRRISLMEAFQGTPYIQHTYFMGNGFDITHANSVMKLEDDMAGAFPMFNPGDLLVSMKTGSWLAVIDEKTAKIKWMARGPWRGQHMARFLPTGKIQFYDNSGDDASSRVMTIDPATLAVTDTFSSIAMSSEVMSGAKLLPGGNTLIFESEHKIYRGGRMFEIAPNKDLLWRYQMPVAIWDAELLPPEYFTENFCKRVACHNAMP